MSYVTAAELREKMKDLLDTVEHTHERVVVTRTGKPSAVLIAPDDLESLEETIAVLSDAGLMAQLRESDADITAGRVRPLSEYLAERSAATK